MGQVNFPIFCLRYQLLPLLATKNILFLFLSHLTTSRNLIWQSVYNHLYSVHAIYINFSHPDPFQDTLHLHKVLCAICLEQTIPAKCNWILLIRCLSSPIYPAGSPFHATMWPAFMVAHFGLLYCGEFKIPDHFSFNPTRNLFNHDVKPIFLQGTLVTFLFIKISKTDPFHHSQCSHWLHWHLSL